MYKSIGTRDNLPLVLYSPTDTLQSPSGVHGGTILNHCNDEHKFLIPLKICTGKIAKQQEPENSYHQLKTKQKSYVSTSTDYF